ncbi:hypothetical protein BKA61DRAFT_283395 [Leptodontidium sp. MPI-SDFR-AT-0119]|nr:hypothetical protein BKA61DRAFT_283395 [Leptodontidium sp. MPI-SDFR-AT-0119]
MARHPPSLVHLVLGFLPPILLTVSFALSLKSTMTGNWAMRENFSTDFPPQDQGLIHRSPFTSCESVFGNHTRNGTVVEAWGEQCTRYARPGASCDASDSGLDYLALCQQIHLTGSLLVVDCVFAGLAFAMSWFLCLVGMIAHKLKEDHHHHHPNEESSTPHEGRVAHAYPFHRYTASPLHLFAVIAFVAAFLAAMIGGNALVNLSPPNGAFESAGAAASKNSAWSFDTGYSFASASWILAAFGAGAVQWVWGRGVGRED